MIECCSCGECLGSHKTSPSPKLRYIWLECEAWKTRISFCDCCQPTDETLLKIAQKHLHKWGLTPDKGLQWGEEVPLETYVSELNGGKCKDCGEALGEKAHREGWWTYHPECRGIHEYLFKPKGD